jgi:hypothetical protein
VRLSLSFGKNFPESQQGRMTRFVLLSEKSGVELKPRDLKGEKSSYHKPQETARGTALV